MTKPYINNAIIGNSRMLGCISEKGELIRLFWPNIDYPQHVDRMLSGVFNTGQQNSTVWLSDDSFSHSQQYVKDTNVLETMCVNWDKGVRILQKDYVLPDKDILIRQYEIENTKDCHTDLSFVVFSSFITTTPELRSTLFDFDNEALIYYRHGYYISISADREAFQFQLGNNPHDSAVFTELKGYDTIGMMPDGAISWKLGEFKPGEKKCFTVHICASDTHKGVKRMISSIRGSDISLEYSKTENYWLDYVKNAKSVNTGRDEIDNLYKRSLLVFKLMADEKGGLLAAPEVDEDFTRCGRYAYCWGRDAAFITGALDKCGLTDVVDKFYKWAADIQDDDGSWQQRYHMDGNIAPSWGLQIDETGTLIWGILEHYKVTGDMSFLKEMWETVRKGVNFMLNFTDPETGLPKPSYDLWEERVGEHTYSSASVWGGIKAGAEVARILGIQEQTELWELAAGQMKDAIIKHLWKDENKCFLRSVRTKLNPWGGEHSQNTVVIKANPKGYYRDVTLEDPMVDVSLLGIAVPFGVLDVENYRVVDSVEKIERVLSSPVGGIRRYENDGYIGGNPWILTTLWVALYYLQKKDFDKARHYFEWSLKGRTQLDLLPEQVNRENGRPEWIIPLTWSHAMFVLVLIGLLDAGELR